MIGQRHFSRTRLERLETNPPVAVAAVEYERLLGYPRNHAMGERAAELAAAAKAWYANHGRPWYYVREVDVDLDGASTQIEGVEFESPALREQVKAFDVERAFVVAISAGAGCELHARRLWEEAKPDEYFFLEVFGSAVVEHLVAGVNGGMCELAESQGLKALPHFSPGYTGWDVTEQQKLFQLITKGLTRALPEPLEVLPSGMLNPKKSLLALVCLTNSAVSKSSVPCESCSLESCNYRRARYRHAVDQPAVAAAPSPTSAKYTLNSRALAKWSRERLQLTTAADGTIEAVFRFDGTTCSNLGIPLAFDYHVRLGNSLAGYPILDTRCRPAPGNDGYKSMCAFRTDPVGLMMAIDGERPLLGQPLDSVMTWSRSAVSSGCHCDADTRAHKWGMVFEVIHFALNQAGKITPTPALTGSSIS